MTIACENPQIIFNPHLVWLYCTKAIAAYFNGRTIEVYKDRKCFYNFPWRDFYSVKNEVTKDNIENYFLYDDQDNTYPIFVMVPCGKCRLCRQKRAEDWQTRCLCESSAWPYPPLFITLTYDRQHLPEDGVSKDDVQKFLKRLRRRIEYNLNVKTPLRYFLVAEYGKKTHRAHYHLLLWNMPYVQMADGDEKSFYTLWRFIRDAWQNGNIRVEYCRDRTGKYCLKYMRKECIVPDGKNDIFFLSSRGREHKGIGFPWLEQYFDFYQQLEDCQQLAIRTIDGKTGVSKVENKPVPEYFKRKLWPTVCNCFPQRVSNAVKDFMKYGTEMFYLFQARRDYDRCDIILDQMRTVQSKFSDIFPIDFDCAYPDHEFCAKVDGYVAAHDLFYCYRPLPLTQETRAISESLHPFYDIDHARELKFYKDTPDVKCLRNGLGYDCDFVFEYNIDSIYISNDSYLCRLAFIRSYKKYSAACRVLDDYSFSQDDHDRIVRILDLSRKHKMTVHLLNENKPEVDVDGLIHKYETDRRWERIHWLEDKF